MFKKYINIALVLVALAVPSITFAQTASTTPYQISKVFMQNFRLDATSYKAGSTIHGSFNLIGGGNVDSSDVYYRLLYMGDYNNHRIPSILYQTGTPVGPIFVPVKGNVLETFNFTLPQAAATSSAGIELQLVTQAGRVLGWMDAPFILSGWTSMINVPYADILVGNNFFGLNTGPTVSTTTGAKLQLTLVNPGATAVTVIPKIVIYNRVIGTVPLLATSTSPVTLAKNETTAVSYPLPLFDNVPGVYAGTISFVDAQGIIRSPQLTFRYIVPGNIATIQSASLSSETANVNQPIKVAVTYVGAPDNILTYQAPNQGQGQLGITIYNRKGIPIAQSTTTGSLNGLVTKTITLTPTVAGQGLYATVILAQGAKVLSTLTTSPPPPPPQNKFSLIGLWYLLVALVLLGIIFVSRWWKKRSASVFFVAVFITAGALTVPIFTPTSVHAETLGGSNCDSGQQDACDYNWTFNGLTNTYWPGILLLTPDDMMIEALDTTFAQYVGPDQMYPGDTFDVQAQVNAVACSNSLEWLTYSDTFPSDPLGLVTHEGSTTAAYGTTNDGTCTGSTSTTTNLSSHCLSTSVNTIDLGTFVAPTTPGVYFLTFAIANNWTGGPNGQSTSATTVYGTVEIDVVLPPPVYSTSWCYPIQNSQYGLSGSVPGFRNSWFTGELDPTIGGYFIDVSSDNFQTFWREPLPPKSDTFDIIMGPLNGNTYGYNASLPLVNGNAYSSRLIYSPNNNPDNSANVSGYTWGSLSWLPSYYYTNGGESSSCGPTVSLTASPPNITYGSSTLLTWSSNNAQTCTGYGTGFSTGGSLTGTTSVVPSTTGTSPYTVACVDSNNNTAFATADVGVNSPPTPPPSASTNLTATTDACFTSPTTTGSITLNWTAPTTGTVTSYGIYSDSAGTQHIGTSTNTSFAVTGLTSGAPYDTFSVRSYNSSGYSAAVDQTSSADASSECPVSSATVSIDPSTSTTCSSGTLTWSVAGVSSTDGSNWLCHPTGTDSSWADQSGGTSKDFYLTSPVNNYNYYNSTKGYYTNSVTINGTSGQSDTYGLTCTDITNASNTVTSPNSTFTLNGCPSGTSGTGSNSNGNYFPY